MEIFQIPSRFDEPLDTRESFNYNIASWSNYNYSKIFIKIKTKNIKI